MMDRREAVPMQERIALLNEMIEHQRRACVAHDRNASHSPEMSQHKWRRLRALRAIREDVHHWQTVIRLQGQLASVVMATTPLPEFEPEEDNHDASR